jgi:hypothetical protein
MRTVQMHVSQQAFGATMGAMRAWLDGHGDPVVRFESSSDNGDILIIIGFASDELGEAFEREFCPPAAAAPLAA